jgi:hypothetical protein
MAEVTKGMVTERRAYALLVGVGVFLTWTANIFEIISYASRAFALYYSIQSSIAAIRAAHRGSARQTVFFVAMAVLGGAITLFGTSVE